MSFWKKREPKQVFYISGKELQPQHFGRLAVDVACQALPSFMSKLNGCAENGLFPILTREQTAHLQFHFFAFIVAPFFAFARQTSKVPEEIYLRIAAGVIFGFQERSNLSGFHLTDDETVAFSQSIAKYTSLVFSEKHGPYGPAAMLCSSYVLSKLANNHLSDEQLSKPEYLSLPLLLEAEMRECLNALESLNVHYAELD